jgi:PAS domain S-box-containing protein
LGAKRKRTSEKPPDVEAELRQLERRFEGLIELSSEWYWEQDEDLRYTLLTGSTAGHGGLDPKKFIGTYRWDRGAVPIGDGGSWDKHKASLGGNVHRFPVQAPRPRGRFRYVSASGHPVFDERPFRGTRRARHHEEPPRRSALALEHAITRCLAEAPSASAALHATIRAICESENWECGRYFAADEKAGVLRFAEAWGIAGEAVERFIAGSRDVTYAPGVGLAGQVWQSGKPLWASDIFKDARVAQSKLARDTGMHGAFVFPVTSEGKVVGVLTCTSREVREPDERLLRAIHVIGSQIGQYLQRKQGEEEHRRFRVAMDNSADMIVLIDRATMRFADVNNTACRLLGYSREELLQMGPQDVLPASRAELERAYDEFIENPSHIRGMHSYYRRKDGSTFPFESTRHVLHSGATRIIAAISRDITERKRAEELQALEHAVTRCLAEADSVSDALKAVMRVVCETLGWDCGRYSARTTRACSASPRAGTYRARPWTGSSPIRPSAFELGRESWARPERASRNGSRTSPGRAGDQQENDGGRPRHARRLHVSVMSGRRTSACCPSPAAKSASPTSGFSRPCGSSAPRSASSSSARRRKKWCARARSASAASRSCPRTCTGSRTRSSASPR